MEREKDFRVWTFFGFVGAVGLGIALMPLRGIVSASNLAFAFVIFTIIMAELGGRVSGVVSAVMSAVSLNFFLTKPYLNLRIDMPDDLIAFFALIVAGLVSAAFGKRRHTYADMAGRVVAELGILDKLVDQLRDGAPLEKILRGLQESFELGAIVMKDAAGNAVAKVPEDAGLPPAKTQLNVESLFPSQEQVHRIGAKGFRLPEGGGRLSLPTGRGEVSIELWEGNPDGLNKDESRTLTIAASLLLMELAHQQERQPAA